MSDPRSPFADRGSSNQAASISAVSELHVGKFSETLMDHVTSPRNSGVMELPDLTGTAGVPGSGPFMVLSLRVQEGRITAAKFQTYGCGPTIVSGSMLTEMIIGRTIEECRELTAECMDRRCCELRGRYTQLLWGPEQRGGAMSWFECPAWSSVSLERIFPANGCERSPIH